MQAIYEFIEAAVSEKAFAWFNELSQAIYSLERFAERGAAVPEKKKLRQFVFGAKPGIYKIIYTFDKRKRVVNILHIRHGARRATSPL